MVKFSSISSEEYKEAENFKITYGVYSSPYGNCLIGVTGSEKAVCYLWFFDNLKEGLKNLQSEWPGGELEEDQSQIDDIAEAIFSKDKRENLHVLLRGTDFQVSVWKALAQIPEGTTITYSDAAELVGNPKAIRAAAKVVASNRIAYLIPCHRVFPKGGNNKYRWGPEKKMEILEHEKKFGY